MKKRLVNHIAMIDNYLMGEFRPSSHRELLTYHLQQISFMQHERLIHLIVTVLFALMTFGSMFVMLITQEASLLFLILALLVLLVPYVFHYYTLENGVQKMYRQYDALLKMKESNEK